MFKLANIRNIEELLNELKEYALEVHAPPYALEVHAL